MNESPGGATVLVGDTGGDPVVLGAVGFGECVVEAPPWVLPLAGPAQPVATTTMIATSVRTRSPPRSAEALDVLIFWTLTTIAH
jgi:hypothetical protein